LIFSPGEFFEKTFYISPEGVVQHLERLTGSRFSTRFFILLSFPSPFS